MFTKNLIAGLLMAGFLSASFAVDAEAGTMDSWPQTMDELTMAYNCGPYADREASKKCKE